ncbi:unnamed protein product [Nyctereutes procyonoides]|uniref:(raccoon dog) hypothetical protein n=1 Tax=Nyctereutes procyonoides TaxID=34880 RepID=A0A811ZYQ3_NYCPR|nr:unnamed protein product [Nyctereutes procyonoides]
MRTPRDGSRNHGVDSSPLRRRLANLTITRQQKRRRRRLPWYRWARKRELINQVISLVEQTQPNESLLTTLLTVLAITTPPVSKAAVYWAYVPDPPTIRPVTWDDPTPQIHTNMTEYFGGSSSDGMEVANHSISWTGLAA